MLAIATACMPAEEKTKTPVATTTIVRATDSSGTMPATVSPATAAVNDSMVRPAVIPAAVGVACDSAVAIVRATLSLMTDRKEGNYHDTARGTPRTGCRLSARGSFKALPETGGPVDLLHAAFIRAGWRPDLHYSADGPDGSDVGMRRRGILCLVTGSWNGGDDSDTVTRAPTAAEDIYRIVVECSRDLGSNADADVPDST